MFTVCQVSKCLCEPRLLSGSHCTQTTYSLCVGLEELCLHKSKVASFDVGKENGNGPHHFSLTLKKKKSFSCLFFFAFLFFSFLPVIQLAAFSENSLYSLFEMAE